ncbi:response regulator [Pedobacter fastidiosus]|uniref:Response regulator n=1 Tax=Pedobacter fastidiosus TaxID=2765361 RepID=A0ABR7KXP2_9SPHI|nr:response regulator [Pedobacter fastidiosus]MBC6112889.1 response regulator [Pedobacter fastidiosus]
MEVLIANNHQTIRYGLTLVVEELWDGCTIFEANTLNEVVSIISAQDIDLVIFDVNVPDSENLEDLMHFISKETDVVVLLGNEKDAKRIASLQEAGVAKFLFRDHSIEDLKAILCS